MHIMANENLGGEREQDDCIVVAKWPRGKEEPEGDEAICVASSL